MRDLSLRHVDTPVVVCGLYNCGTWTLQLRCAGLICPMACGILVSPPGTEPLSPALEVWSLNHWTAREVSPVGLLHSPPQCSTLENPMDG